MTLPPLTGDHARDLVALREHLRSTQGWPNTELIHVLDAAITILADFQRTLAAVDFEVKHHQHSFVGPSNDVTTTGKSA